MTGPTFLSLRKTSPKGFLVGASFLVASVWFGACSGDDDEGTDASSLTPTSSSSPATPGSNSGPTSMSPANGAMPGADPTLGITPFPSSTLPTNGSPSNPTMPPSATMPPSSSSSGGSGNAPDSSAGAPGVGGVTGIAGSDSGGGGADGAGAGGGFDQGGTPSDGGEAGREATAGVGNETGVAGGENTPTDSPCPTDEPCRILPLGDSITDGVASSGGGYRVEHFRLALEAGFDITFVGNSMNGPMTVDGEPFPRAHEGHSGWTVEQIDGIVPDPALNGDPHIILLHIGTNDMYQTPQGAPERLGTLIDQIIADNPDALLVVSNIIPFPGSDNVVSEYNDAVVGVVEQRAEQGARILFVDQFTGFPTSELADGVHPNDAGYAIMAGVWFEAIETYLR